MDHPWFETARLRELLDLRSRLPPEPIAADILREATPTRGLTVILSKGASAGVRPFSPVVTPRGLLGVVRSVDPGRSVAVLWTHPDFRVGAMTSDGSVFGLVRPGGGDPDVMTMLLTLVPYRDTIPAGTPLFTSGFGDVYPRGIRIGTVLRLASEQEGVARTYLVRAAAHPGSARHVIILVTSAHDVGTAYGLGGTP